MKNSGSISSIENYYVSIGYRNYNLRKALKKDKMYQELLKKRKENMFCLLTKTS